MHGLVLGNQRQVIPWFCVLCALPHVKHACNLCVDGLQDVDVKPTLGDKEPHVSHGPSGDHDVKMNDTAGHGDQDSAGQCGRALQPQAPQVLTNLSGTPYEDVLLALLERLRCSKQQHPYVTKSRIVSADVLDAAIRCDPPNKLLLGRRTAVTRGKKISLICLRSQVHLMASRFFKVSWL